VAAVVRGVFASVNCGMTAHIFPRTLHVVISPHSTFYTCFTTE